MHHGWMDGLIFLITLNVERRRKSYCSRVNAEILWAVILFIARREIVVRNGMFE